MCFITTFRNCGWRCHLYHLHWIYCRRSSAVAETRSSPLPQPINYGHTGDKKGKIFLLTLHTLVCYQTKCMNVCSLLLSFEYKEGKENFGCMSERILRFVHLLLFFSLFHCLSIKYWTFSMKKLQKWLDVVYETYFRFCRFSPIFLLRNASKFRFLWRNSN